MKLFTDVGIEKFKTLLQALTNIQTQSAAPSSNNNNNKPGTSAYSQKITAKCIQMLIAFITHNDSEFWSKSANQKQLIGDIDMIDHATGTKVPEVFNDESRAVAGALLSLIQEINLKTDLTDAASTLLKIVASTGSDVNTIIQNMCRSLEVKIKFYDECKNGQGFLKKELDIRSAAVPFFEDLKKQEKITPEDYEKQIQEYIQAIKEIPYYRVSNISCFVNAEQPYQDNLDTDVFEPKSFRGSLLRGLLRMEFDLNKTFIAQNKQPLTAVYNYCINQYSTEKDNAHRQEFKTAIDTAIASCNAYKTHYTGITKLFKTVNPEKTKIVDDVIALLTSEYSKMDNYAHTPSDCIFRCYSAICKAAQNNAVLSRNQGLAPGECAKIMNAQIEVFLNLWFSNNETNDVLLNKELHDCKEKMPTLPSPPAMPAINKAEETASSTPKK